MRIRLIFSEHLPIFIIVLNLVKCAPGSYEDGTCLPCAIGSYQPMDGQTSCVACPVNFTTANRGTRDPANCDGRTFQHSMKNGPFLYCYVCKKVGVADYGINIVLFVMKVLKMNNKY